MWGKSCNRSRLRQGCCANTANCNYLTGVQAGWAAHIAHEKTKQKTDELKFNSSVGLDTWISFYVIS